MAQTTRTFRIFVSSTFSDLKEERNALQKTVFPRLRELCTQHGCRFQAIDLRWGVSEEAGRHNRTMRICLRELKRCQEGTAKPNFLILLGDRYGWRPLSDTIPADLFERLKEHIAAESEETADLLSNCYRRDNNAVPPAYILQPRQEDDAHWYGIVEPTLLAALQRAADAIGSDPRLEALAIGVSATHQEIIHGALAVPDAREHVHAFFRTIRYQPGQQPAKDFVDHMPDDAPDPDAQTRLTKLKEKVTGHIGTGNVHGYTLNWRDGGSFADTDLARFREEIYRTLESVVLSQINQLERIPPEQQEENAHRDFGQERRDGFVGRDELLDRLAVHLATGTGRPLAVVGPAGSGKSAFMAKAIERARAAHPNATIIERYIGASPASSDLITLLRNVVVAIGHKYPAPLPANPEEKVPRDEDLPFEINLLIAALQQALERPTAESPLFVFLDALDQLSDTNQAHQLNWLPATVPAHVSLVVSAAMPEGRDGPPGRPNSLTESVRSAVAPIQHASAAALWRVLDSRFAVNDRIILDKLSREQGEQMLDHWLGNAQRTLQPTQRDAVLRTFAIDGSPLWLRTATTEAARYANWQSLPDFPPDTSGLMRHILEKLSVEEEHGDMLVGRALGYLTCARHGLAEDEMLDVLSADPEVMENFRRRYPKSPPVSSLPVAVWVAFRGDIAGYLAEHDAQYTRLMRFYHRSFREAVETKFLAEQDRSCARHRNLAGYFEGCAHGSDAEKKWETNSVRGFAECVFHLINAGQHEQAVRLLSSFPFLLHKLRVGLLDGVFEDYEMVRRDAPPTVVKQLEIWDEFFREKGHILRRGNDEWPAHKILLQLAVEHADDSSLTVGAEQWVKENRCDWLLLRRVPRLSHAGKNPCLAVLEGHTWPISGALALAYGRLLSWSGDKTLRVWDGQSGACLAVLEGHTGEVHGALALADGRLLSWGADNALRLWNGLTGACLAMLVGHTYSVKGALELADGRLLSWQVRDIEDCDDLGRSNVPLRLWDGQTGECLAVLEGHTGQVNGALALADGRLLSWSGWPDNTLRLWNGQSGACMAVLEGHTSDVYCALVVPDGRLLSWAGYNLWSKDHTLRLWDGQSGVCLAVLEGHSGNVIGALALADGGLLSWSVDKTLRLWDGQRGVCLAVLEGHSESVGGALALADGRLLSWSGDKTLRLWDRHSGACLSVLEGHTGKVHGALSFGNGLLLSWSDDKTLRLWDGQTGVCLAVLEGHNGDVRGALALADGRLLSWSGFTDNTLRLWDGHSRGCWEVPEGHTESVNGALALADGQLLSWGDKTLRLWDCHSGACLAMLEAHTGGVSGALALVGGRLLSWGDKTLRLWDRHSGACLAVLEGHTGEVYGALALADGRLLSWGDKTLRLWDGQSGVCLAVLEGHTSYVHGALALADGRLLSWSADKTLRLWDGNSRIWRRFLKAVRLRDRDSGTCLAVLEGHTDSVNGALALGNGRLLSWSDDRTLRLWDGQKGICLAVLEGHFFSKALEERLSEAGLPLFGKVDGAFALADGRLLSWSGSPDNRLRVWNGQSGACLAVLEGHTSDVYCALELADRRLLSWSSDETLRLWDSQSGACLEMVPTGQVARRHPEWLYERAKDQVPGEVSHDFFVGASARSARLRHKTTASILAAWNADSDAASRCLLADGTAVVTQANGQVCILKLHYGQRRISLAEVEATISPNSAR